MKWPPKERRGHYAAPRTNKVTGAYQFPSFLQSLGNGTNGKVKHHGFFHQWHCVVCNVPVDNENLGGHSGRSALSSSLFCLCCGDRRQQLLLRLDLIWLNSK
jgi:hypothetical protein